MLNLKRCNFFTGDIDALTSISSILRILEFENINHLSFCKKESTLKHSLSNCIFFKNYEDFKKILEDKSNLFRVNLLIFDFMNLSVGDIIKWKEIIDLTELNHIIIAKEYYYKVNSEITDYHFKREYKFDGGGFLPTKSYVHISDNINKWSSDLESLRTAYIRDRKIDDLFGDDIN